MKILSTRPLILSQVREIVSLDLLCFGGFWSTEGYEREIDSPNSSLLTLQLSDEKLAEGKSFLSPQKIIGLGCLWSIVDEAHITLLGVHPDYRRKGFGTLLLLTLLEDAIARQLKWATLEVNVNNINAINLYQKFGFDIAGTRKKYYQSTGDDASILWLKGLQTDAFQASLARWQNSLRMNLRNNHYCWDKS